MTTFALPDLGEGLQEAEIVAWHVGAGERIVADQPLVSVETAKAVVEVPSPWSGRVTVLHVMPGDIVAIGAPLVDIDVGSAVEDSGTVVGALPDAPGSRGLARTTPAPSPPPSGSGAGQVRIAPALRKLAADLGIDPVRVTGTGPNGSITRDDIEIAAKVGREASAFTPLRGVRRAMAETMQLSSAVVPATVCDEAIIEAWTAGTDPTIRLIRAVVAGCRASPTLNAWLDATARTVLQHARIDLGIAMETDDGLFAPVLRDVANRSDTGLRAGLDAMKRDVAARSIPLTELRGQTLSLSNFGMLGGLTAALSIVPPQVAILGAGRIHRAVRPIGDEIRIVSVLPLSLTFDHRAVTGAEAIRFLTAALNDLTKP
jgi:pyruvate dehydrogenase E2 component (dihydrolipoamide acetyltransferase)